MSDAAQGALIAGGFATLVAAIGYLFQYLSAKGEREERYRLQLFDKTLTTYQDAFNWMMRLVEPIERARELSGPDGNLPDGFQNGLETLYSNAREWWNANCLYLDDKSRVNTYDFIEIAGAYIRMELTPSQEEMYSTRSAALRAIQQGIGKKHLPNLEQTRAPRTSHD